jgi:hypothetical protein
MSIKGRTVGPAVRRLVNESLPHLRVLRLGFFQDGDVRVGVFADCETSLLR